MKYSSFFHLLYVLAPQAPHSCLFWRWKSQELRLKYQNNSAADVIDTGFLIVILNNNTYTSVISVEVIDIANVSNAKYLRDNHVSPLNVMYRYLDVMYGHIHMAETGVTSNNGIFANNFERVCGHKGYSYNYYQANKRFKEYNHNINIWCGRYRVMFDIMDNIGFYYCDIICDDILWKFWLQFNQLHNTLMKLHLPCRDPIHHIMTQCHSRHKSFNYKMFLTCLLSIILGPASFILIALTTNSNNWKIFVWSIIIFGISLRPTWITCEINFNQGGLFLVTIKEKIIMLMSRKINVFANTRVRCKWLKAIS